MEKRNFQPITKALAILEITRGMLDSSRDQLETMQQVKDRPHILDDAIIDRSLKLYTAQNEDSDMFLQQCAIWRKQELNEVQSYQIQEIEKCTKSLIDTNNQILFIINACKDSTIDKILEKSDMELALDMLTGKSVFPRED
jgi:cystathionine beta-lyase family protein involved in aluminum resistance